MLTYLLPYSMVQSPSWEANWFAASQEIPLISRNPKVHYRTHKRPPSFPILGHPNPVHIPTSHLLEIHPNIIHSSKSRSPQWSPSLRFPHQHPLHPPLLTHMRHMPSASNSSRLPRPSQVQIFSSTPGSQTPSASFPPAMSATIHTHISVLFSITHNMLFHNRILLGDYFRVLV